MEEILKSKIGSGIGINKKSTGNRKGKIMRKTLKRIGVVVLTCFMTVGVSLTAFGAGWEQQGNDWYYRGNSGEYLKNNWVYVDGKNYYLGADGKMLTGEHTIVYRACKFDESGALVEEGAPVEVPGLNMEDLNTAQKAVRDCWSAIERGYEMVNEQRIANGAAPTLLNYDLCVAAAYRCIEMEKMERLSEQQYGWCYSGPDENGKMLWDTVSQALTGNGAYAGTENKSKAVVEGYGNFTWLFDSGKAVGDLESLLAGQFTSASHYAQVIGPEYGQIGIAIYYTDQQGSYRLAEEIKIGE